jgi:hypothetical protein
MGRFLASLRSTRHAVRAVLDTGLVAAGLVEYWIRGRMRPNVRHTLLRLHCRTNGRGTALFTPLLRLAWPSRPRAAADGVLGSLSVVRQDEIAAAIDRDGFYIFDNRLPQATCDAIEAHARATPARIETGDAPMLFDPERPLSKTYRIQEHDIVQSVAMQGLMADPSILAVAEAYLKTLPVLSGVNLWFSPAYGNAPGEEAAQEFHFDFDPPPIWLLFFVYLSDVGPDNGPHIFVRGTHKPGKKGMAALLKRGYARIPDEDIVQTFGAANVVELYGKRGTILAVDTRGMHKGKMPVTGHRLMAQLTFATPPFSTTHGDHVALPAALSPQLAGAVKAAPRVYGRYLG